MDGFFSNFIRTLFDCYPGHKSKAINPFTRKFHENYLLETLIIIDEKIFKNLFGGLINTANDGNLIKQGFSKIHQFCSNVTLSDKPADKDNGQCNNDPQSRYVNAQKCSRLIRLRNEIQEIVHHPDKEGKDINRQSQGDSNCQPG